MISAIFFDASLIDAMVCTTCATTSPPRPATSLAELASTLAWRALLAFWATVEVSSSIELAVSSSEPACCSVRADRSRLPAAISDEAVAIACAPPRISVTRPSSWSFMSASASCSAPISSFDVAWRRKLRSPAATRRASATAAATGRVMPRVSHQAQTAPKATLSTPSRITVRLLSCLICWISPRRASTRLRCSVTRYWMLAW